MNRLWYRCAYPTSHIHWWNSYFYISNLQIAQLILIVFDIIILITCNPNLVFHIQQTTLLKKNRRSQHMLKLTTSSKIVCVIMKSFQSPIRLYFIVEYNIYKIVVIEFLSIKLSRLCLSSSIWQLWQNSGLGDYMVRSINAKAAYYGFSHIYIYIQNP